MIPVKICGITSIVDANMAIKYGASAIGMIFYKESPRYIHPHKAKEWISEISGQMKKVGVFVNEVPETIISAAEELNLDYIQLHGDESPDYCNNIKTSIIKVFHVDNYFDTAVLQDYNVHAFLFDTYQKGKFGGTGERFNWHLITDLITETPIILSGGLNSDNIINGIETIQPSAVDVNSGVESGPGVKDDKKLRQLFNVLKNTESNANIFNNSIEE